MFMHELCFDTVSPRCYKFVFNALMGSWQPCMGASRYAPPSPDSRTVLLPIKRINVTRLAVDDPLHS